MKKKKSRALFYKVLFICVEVYSMGLLAMSYYLSYIGRDVVLEDLSKTIVKAIIYPFIAFTINRTLENLAEHNISTIHKPITEYKEEEE